MIGVALAALNLLIERLRFFARIVHITPIPDNGVINNKLGSLWILDQHTQPPTVTFGQVFRTKQAARAAYRLFRIWNRGRYHDRRGDIVLRIISEKLDRYTILLHPGPRGLDDWYEQAVKQIHGPKTDVCLQVLAFIFITYADYWNRPHMKRTVETLRDVHEVQLNCYYAVDQEPLPVARRFLTLSQIELVTRDALCPGDMGYGLPWHEPWEGVSGEDRRMCEAAIGPTDRGIGDNAS
jgi:hypothetical protein